MSAEIGSSQWRLVEVGRVVLLENGTDAGKLATIVEIIDHKRILIDGPSTDCKAAVPRQAIATAKVVLTSIVLPKLPRSARTGTVKAAWAKAGIEEKWQATAWAKKRAQKEARSSLTAFQRFEVLRLKKQRRFQVRKENARIVKAAK